MSKHMATSSTTQPVPCPRTYKQATFKQQHSITAKLAAAKQRTLRVAGLCWINLDELPSEGICALRLYQAELHNHSQIAPDRRDLKAAQALGQRAKAGDEQAREQIILCSLRYVFFVAVSLAYQHRIADAMELVGVGNMAIMEHLERAYDHVSPFGYLWLCARGIMTRWAERHSTLIALPSGQQTDKEASPSLQVLSMDAPGPDGQLWQEDLAAPDLVLPTDLTPLVEAVEALGELERELVKRTFGLEAEPQTIQQIIREASSLPCRPRTLYYRLQSALTTLERTLAPAYRVSE